MRGQSLRSLLAALVALGLLVGLTGCTGSEADPDAEAPSDSLGWLTPRKQITVPLPAGEPITGTAAADAPLTLINFWASTCDPCREEMPLLDEINKDPDVSVVGVSRDQFASYAREFVDEVGTKFPSWHDPDGYYLERFAGVLSLIAVPATALVKDGRVVAVHPGDFKSRAEIERVLDQYR